MNNGDKIRSMNDIELADWINKVLNDGDEFLNYCQNKDICRKKLDTDEGIPSSWCDECLFDWVRRD